MSLRLASKGAALLMATLTSTMIPPSHGSYPHFTLGSSGNKIWRSCMHPDGVGGQIKATRLIPTLNSPMHVFTAGCQCPDPSPAFQRTLFAGQQVFTSSPTSLNPYTARPPLPPITGPSPSSSGASSSLLGPGPWAIAGAVIGSVLGAVLLGLTLFCLIRRFMKRSNLRLVPFVELSLEHV